MKLIKRINNKDSILLGVFFILMTISYTTNLFHISNPDLFHGFERQPEGLVVGRLERSAQDGIFSYGGLNGINYDSKTDRSPEQYAADLAKQHHIYITNESTPDSYQAYKSQSGGQGLVFSIIQKISPLTNAQNLMLFRGLNALLIAFVFCLFGWWVLRHFGFITGFITLFFIFISPWINVFSHNLWWVLWSFYLPFISMLLALDCKSRYPNELSDTRLFLILFVAVFTKCFFTGFEFITTTLIAALCPIVYYYYKEGKTFRQFFIFGLKASIAIVLGVIAQMGMLITQIKFLEGTLSDGINHLILSFTKRTATEAASFGEVLGMYFQDDAFALGFMPNSMQFYFGVLILLIVICSLVLLRQNNKMIRALSITTIFSILAPLSWLIIFKQHAFEHPHMDYIIWYMPFLLYGFSIIGVMGSLIFHKIKR